MKIVILNGSPHKKGNTKTMAEEFARGAHDAGHEVEIVELGGKKIAGCLGCYHCFKNPGVCVQHDDMAEVLEKLDVADVCVFASPIYWFDITAQLKTVIDRMFARGATGFNFSKCALLLNSGSDGVYTAALAQYKDTCAYLKWESLGELSIPGMDAEHHMADSPLLPKAYELGKSL